MASPNFSPKHIHEKIVAIIRIPIDNSLRFIFPMHAVLLTNNVRAFFTSLISAGKRTINNQYVTASIVITAGSVASIHLKKPMDSPVVS